MATILVFGIKRGTGTRPNDVQPPSQPSTVQSAEEAEEQPSQPTVVQPAEEIEQQPIRTAAIQSAREAERLLRSKSENAEIWDFEFDGFQTLYIAFRDFPEDIFHQYDDGITGYVFQSLSKASGRVEYHYVVTEAGRVYYKRPNGSVYNGAPPRASVP